MTETAADELLRLRTAMLWSRQDLGDLIGCSEGLIKLMEVGRREVPQTVSVWLRAIAVWVERHPPPRDWRVFVDRKPVKKGQTRERFSHDRRRTGAARL